MSVTLPMEEFTAALASGEPTPGGGAAAALAGALAASLGAMSARCTLERGEDEVLSALLGEVDALRGDFLRLADCDSETYRAYAALRAMTKDEPNRAAMLEAGLFAATQPPMTTMRFACRAIALLERLLRRSSAALWPDLAVGAALARAALAAAAVTVRANAAQMTERGTAELLEQEADTRLAEYGARAQALYHAVYDRDR